MKRSGSLNCIYRLIWSEVTKSWVAVAETTRGKSKGGGRSERRRLVAALLSLTAVTFAAPYAMAGPTGGQVVSGSGTITQTGQTTTIKQSTQNLSLNWNTFNIAPQETVDFVQPSASAIAVNRIFDPNGSQILGHLEANGQVYLINPNGILFGAGAQVNVGGLVASTLDLNDADLAGNTRAFSGNGSGSVVNQGTITAANGGYVALLGNHVSNQGTVTAQLGTVALGSGNAVSLSFDGDSLVHMQVDRSVLNSLAENGGLIHADGGTVIMTAGSANSLLASVVNNTGVIEARTVQNLGTDQSGTITLLGGMTSGTVNVGGTLDASAPGGGNGGVIMTSAANVKIADGTKVTTTATAGLTGSWVVDPTNFTVATGSGAQTVSGIGATTLGNNLGTTSVSISTSGTANGSDLGDININAAFSWNNTNSLTFTAQNNVDVNAAVGWAGGTLTLIAANNIYVNSNLNGSGTAKLALLYGQGSSNGGSSTYAFNNGAYANLPAGTNFSTKLGTSGATTNFTVVTSTAALAGIGTSGDFALGANLTEGGAVAPIGPFSGIFEGLGHNVALNGILGTVSCPDSGATTTCLGLFGEVTASGIVRNVGVSGTVTNAFGSSYGGTLVGQNYGTILNSWSTANNTMTNSMLGSGALMGIGGLVGSNHGTISNSHAAGAVNAGSYGGNQDIGGLVGLNYGGTITKSYATGTVSGSASVVGGLVGAAYGGTISNSYATGSVSGISSIGGLAGYISSNLSGTTVTINNSYATGSVSGSYGLGGLGGIISRALGNVIISNSFSTGSVGNSTASGGLVGQINSPSSNSLTITNSFWNTTTSGQSSSAAGSGKNTAAMQSQSTFTGWDFSGTWSIGSGANASYPFLQAFLTPLTATATASSTYNGSVFSGSGINLAYTSYGLPITPSSALVTGSLSYTGAALTAVHAGTYALTPQGLFTDSQQGYLITNTGDLTISPATLTPTLTNSNVTKTYDGTTNAPAGFTPTYGLTGLIAGDSGATLGDTSVSYNSAHVASATSLTVSGLSISSISGTNASYATDYTLSANAVSVGATISKATLTPTITNSNVTKTYDGTTNAPSGFTPTYSLAGLIAGDSAATLGDTSVAYDSAHAGIATQVTVAGLTINGILSTNGSATSDYALNSNSASVSATITPAPLTATLTNSNVTKVYDGTTSAPSGFTPTYSFVGFASGETGANLGNTGVTYNSAHVGNATQLTVSGLTISSLTGGTGLPGDYALSNPNNSASVMATITPAPLTATLTNSNVTKTYDGTTNAPTGFTPTYSIGGFVSGDNGATLSDNGAAYNSAHVGSATTLTVSGLTITSISGGNSSQPGDYAINSPGNSASVNASISAAPLSVSLSNTTNVTKTYDGTTSAPGGFSPIYSITGLVAGDSAAVSTSATPVFNSVHVASASTITQGGLSITSVSGNGSDGSGIGDYTLGSTIASTNGGVASITPVNLTASAPTIGGNTNKTYDGTPAAINATLTGGSVSGAIAGDTLTLNTSSIALNYNSSHVGSASSISASGSLGVNVAATSSGSESTDYSVALPSIAPVSGTISPATLTPTLTNIGVTKIYDTSNSAPAGFTPTYSYTGFVNGDTGATLSDTSIAYNNAHAGAATNVTVSGLVISSINTTNGSQTGDYTLQSPSVSVAATITPATLNATLTNIGVTKNYDGTTAAPNGFAPTFNVTGFVGGDNGATLSETAVAYNSAHVTSATTVTVSGLTITGVGGANGSLPTDYSLASNSAGVAATIQPATLTPTLINPGVTKTYDGNTAAPQGFTPAYTFTGLVSGDMSANLSDSGAAFNNAHVSGATGLIVSGLGIGAIVGSNGSQTTDYNLTSTSAEVAATITPARLTAALTNTAVTKVYDGTTAAPTGFTPTYSVIGLVSGDTSASLTDNSATFNSAHVNNANGLTVSGLAVSGIVGSNGSQTSDYDLTSSTANVAATITPATLTPTLTNSGVTKAYNGTTAAPSGFTPTFSIAGLVSGDTGATLTDSNVAYNSTHVTSANDLTVSGLGLGSIVGSNGSLASDYTLSPASVSVAATITPANLTAALTNTAVTKTYDGSTAAPTGFTPTYKVTGFITGDTGATLSDSSIAFNSAHVANATGLTVSGLSISGVIGSNGSQITDYDLTSSTETIAATIKPATLTPTLSNTSVTKVYDGTTSAPSGFIPTYSFAGLVAGDTSATLTNTSAIFNSAHVASANELTVSGLGISNIVGSNSSQPNDYALAGTSVSTAIGVASITPAPVTATASIGGTLTKVVDGTTAATGATVIGSITGGAITGDTLALNTSGISLNYDTATTSATTISATGTTSLTISSSADGSLQSDYSLTQPVIAPVPGTITTVAAATNTSLPSPTLFAMQRSTQPMATPCSLDGNSPGCGENTDFVQGQTVRIANNDNVNIQPGLDLHIVNGGVKLPDNLVNISQ